MEALLPILFVLVMVVVVWVVIASTRKQRQRREATLVQLAEQLGGNMVPGTWTRQPELNFQHSGLPVRLWFYSTGGKHPTLYTRLEVKPVSVNQVFQCKIYPEKFMGRLGKFLGTQDIQIGEEQFDSDFMIKGSDEILVKSFLTPQVCQAIFGLRALVMNDHVEVLSKGNLFRIQKLTWLDAQDLLGQFVEQGCQVLDGYLEAAGAGKSTQSFGAPPTSSNTGSSCAVCDDQVEGSNHLCPACGANHHPECFKLNDGCGRCGAGG